MNTENAAAKVKVRSNCLKGYSRTTARPICKRGFQSLEGELEKLKIEGGAFVLCGLCL